MFHCLIFGLPKSGTTALFYAVKKILSAHGKIYDLFEPSIDQINSIYNKTTIPVLIKTLQGQIHAQDFYDLIKGNKGITFHKKISIVRDPRDNLISQMLYRTYDAVFINDSTKLNYWIELIRAKERKPSQISVKYMIDRFSELDENRSPDSEKILNRYDEFIDIMNQYQNDFFVLHYEKFVQGETKNLSAYLGIDMEVYNDTQDSDIPERVLRTASFDNWRSWFIEEDVNFFRSKLERYFRRFNYNENWEFSSPEFLDARTGSEYVLSLVNKRSKKKSITQIGKTIKKIFK